MWRVVTPEEELATRKKNYDRLTNGTLFDLGGKRFFCHRRQTRRHGRCHCIRREQQRAAVARAPVRALNLAL
jgi:hypothetical protein